MHGALGPKKKSTLGKSWGHLNKVRTFVNNDIVILVYVNFSLVGTELFVRSLDAGTSCTQAPELGPGHTDSWAIELKPSCGSCAPRSTEDPSCGEGGEVKKWVAEIQSWLAGKEVQGCPGSHRTVLKPQPIQVCWSGERQLRSFRASCPKPGQPGLSSRGVLEGRL